MPSIKKILILCDAHDCIRHESNYHLLLKQLYVLVFLFKKHFGDDHFTLHINNRAIVGFDVFWKPGSVFCSYLNEFITKRSWTDINMSAYDVIISHPDYQRDLQGHFLKEFGVENSLTVYTLSELQYSCDMIYPTAGSLFTKEGLFKFERTEENDAALATFKQELDQAIDHFTIEKQEAVILQPDQRIKKLHHRMRIEKTANVLILDDYKRAFFIGDSVYWLSKIKKLIAVFPQDCCICLNVANKKAFETISNIFQKSFPARIVITNRNWEKIELDKFDLVLCNNDILLKFYWHITQLSKEAFKKIHLYSFTAMDERPITKQLTLDFYTNIYFSSYANKWKEVNERSNKELFTEISLSKEEHTWAGNWLSRNGVLESDRVITLLHGASSVNKVIYDAELLKLIKEISALSENIKILLVSEKMIADNKWLNGTIKENNCVVVAEALELREVMSLIGNKQIAAVIGPCTGLMHLAESIFTHLLNHKIISASECPLLLTYSGKQAPERNYHPNNWWEKAKIVHCCVCMCKTDGSKNKELIPLIECVLDIESFNKHSVSAREITSDLLLEYITSKFPDFIERLKSSNFNSLGLKTNPGSTCQETSTSPKKIPTFLMNLKARSERRTHILNQFSKRSIFECTLVDAVENKNGSVGLWQTIKKIVSQNIYTENEYILICEDDHMFTEYYSDQKLISCINDAKILKAEILLGGICFCHNDVQQVHKSLISVDHFACAQFIIIFKPLFRKILEAHFAENDCVDFKFAELSNRKLAIYPFISIQKDFGYSDVSSGYYENKMSVYFNETSKVIQNIIK